MNSRRFLVFLMLGLALGLSTATASRATAEEGRLLRMPDIHADQVVFVYAGDLWTVSRAGGEATRLTTFPGMERFPKFSPDGRWIAFTGSYDGNPDVYVIPAQGGEPRRLTFHPGSDQVVEWSPDGKEVYFRSSRLSPTRRYNRMFHVPMDGGWPEPMPLPICERISFSPRGADLVAFTELNREFRTWKRYKGGTAEDIWTYDFRANRSKRITTWEGTDRFPMWHGNTITFNSDREGGKLNLYDYDTGTETITPRTHFTEYDVKWPSQGPNAVVFENGGWLYAMDWTGNEPTRIPVTLHTDAVLARAAVTNVSDLIGSGSVSPSGKRAVFEARGELFTVPAKKGDVRALTSTPGVYERFPAWSPDGKWVAYFSDATGEYELYLRAQDGSGDARQVTHGGRSFRFHPVWSPDSKKVAFGDKTWALRTVDMDSGKLTLVDKGTVGDISDFTWSPDSRWIAYVKGGDNYYGSVWVYSTETGKKERVTDSLTQDYSPTFSPDGKYIYFLSNRHYNPQFSSYAFEYVLRKATGAYALALAKDTPRPFPPQSDEEQPKEETAGKDSGDKKKGAEGEAGKEIEVAIDLDGILDRVSEVPLPDGDYFGLRATKGKLFFLETGAVDPDEGDHLGDNAALKFFDTDKRKVKTVLNGISSYQLTPDGAKVFYRSGRMFGIVDAKADQSMGDGKLDTGSLQTLVDPRAEWKEIFVDAWRLERDFYYDPGMHGLDWEAMRRRYEPLVEHVLHRDDLNYIIGELIGELSTSHTYVYGGDYPDVERVNVGLLGATYVADRNAGRYRFDKIYRISNWDEGIIAPLAQPGIEVHSGDYLLSVNGRPVTTDENLYAAFQDLAGKQTKITVNDSPDTSGARTYVVKPQSNEIPLAYEDWVETNRRRVYEATGGKVAYIHMPNTAMAGIKRFSRDFYNQTDKVGVILDGRYNSGGFIPDYVVDRLGRSFLGLWSRREGKDFRTPRALIPGPKVCVTNAWAGSGGDAIPYFFREANLGPIVGTRTWGGLVGISRGIRLMDGGGVTMPDFGFWIPGKGWQVENHGVDPDYEVLNRPEKVMQGQDPQLEKAIKLVQEGLKKLPPESRRPPYPHEGR